MDVEIRRRGNITIFDVTGKMTDEKQVALLEKRLAPLLDEGERSFVIDLSRVTDSLTVGINAVVGCRNKIVKRDGAIKLVLGERLRGIYTLLFLDNLFEMHGSIEDALASFASS